jgi:hypothetical protein
MTKFKQIKCTVCKKKRIDFPDKLKDIQYEGRYCCDNCGSIYRINRLWYQLTGLIRNGRKETLLLGFLTAGIAFVNLLVLYLIFWPIRFVLTFNRPIKLLERHSKHKAK